MRLRTRPRIDSPKGRASAFQPSPAPLETERQLPPSASPRTSFLSPDACKSPAAPLPPQTAASSPASPARAAPAGCTADGPSAAPARARAPRRASTPAGSRASRPSPPCRPSRSAAATAARARPSAAAAAARPRGQEAPRRRPRRGRVPGPHFPEVQRVHLVRRVVHGQHHVVVAHGHVDGRRLAAVRAVALARERGRAVFAAAMRLVRRRRRRCLARIHVGGAGAAVISVGNVSRVVFAASGPCAAGGGAT